MREGIVPVMDINGNNNGFNGDYGIWWIIIIIILFGGWNRNGFGGSEGAMNNYVLNSDFATLQRQLSDGFNGVEKGIDTIRNGLCDGFYTNAQLINGVNTNILTNSNTIQSQIADSKYETAKGFCSVNNSITLNARDIIDNQNANYRALHDEIIANRLEDKNAQIQAQQNEINALRLSASQSAQNEYLLNSLRNGCPVNAQLVCGNQPIPVRYIDASCGCNSGCGCGM